MNRSRARCEGRSERKVRYRLRSCRADVAELVDAHGSGPCGSNPVKVRFLSSALRRKPRYMRGFLFLGPVELARRASTKRDHPTDSSHKRVLKLTDARWHRHSDTHGTPRYRFL